MKICKNCGTPNADENNFCRTCAHVEFENQSTPIPPIQQMPPYPIPYQQPTQKKNKQKNPISIPDMLAISSLVVAIVGMYASALVLHPVAFIAGFIGMKCSEKYKAIAVAGIVLAALGGFIYMVMNAYYRGGLPRWSTYGAFH